MAALEELTWIQLVFGLAATLVAGVLVSDIYDKTKAAIEELYRDVPPPPGYETFWKSEIVARTPGGEWVGVFEQVIFFASLMLHWGIAATWLTFKLASKWKSWTTTWQAMRPRRTEESRVAFARAHLARAALDHRLFILGTGGNIVAAFAGLLVVRLFAGA